MRFLFYSIFIFFTIPGLFAQSDISYIDDMLEVISNIKTIEYELHAKEIIGDDFVYTNSIVKLQTQPFSFYNYIIEPDLGVEVLFTSKDKYALINPNGFPFVNLKLDPYSRLMRKNQHHTLFDSGFDGLKNIVLSFLNRLREFPTKYISNLGVRIFNNKECQVLEVYNPEFSFIEYVVQKGDNIESIANKFHLSSYLILLENNFSFYTDIEDGDTIFIPSSYAEKFEVWIDLESKLPVVQKIFVKNRLFEHYEFCNIIINPEFRSDEFEKDYIDYGF